MTDDIRWKQRFDNFGRALQKLTEAVELSGQRPLSDLERQGLIQAFEFTHELAWNLLRDYLLYQGGGDPISGSRDAFSRGLIGDGQVWMDMIRSRNLTSHTYNEDVAVEIVAHILTDYHPLFLQLEERFRGLPDA